MKLHKVTYINDFFDETHKEFLCESDDLCALKNLGNQQTKDAEFQDQVWSSLVPPTMGNRKLSEVVKDRLILSAKVYLLIE